MNQEKAEAKKKCFSEEHLEEMRVRYYEYEYDAEIERLLAKHAAVMPGSGTGAGSTSKGSGSK